MAGALCWVTAPQFYLVEWLVSRSWHTTPYRYATHTISDLGALGCGRISGRDVCSPAHTAMNTSLVVLGVAIGLGGLLLGGLLLGAGARWLALLAGLGVVMVGLFPEDAVGVAHGLGAGAFFLAGNAGLVLVGYRRRTPIGAVLCAAGAVGLVSTAAFAAEVAGPQHLGTLERLAGYPVSAGYALAGLSILLTRPDLTRPDLIRPRG